MGGRRGAGGALNGGRVVVAALLLVAGVAVGADAAPTGTADGAVRLLVRPVTPGEAPPLPDGAEPERSATARVLADADGTRVLRADPARVEQVVAALRAHPQVAEVARTAPFAATDHGDADPVEPDDPRWDDQWGLRQLRADHAWAHETGSSEVTIAVLDTGVDEDHEDLAAALTSGRNFVDDRGEDDTDDANGHGTNAAGAAAARGDNGVGIAGVCWRCRIMPVRVLDDDGVGSDADIAAGVHWAVEQGADVLNLSFSGPFDSPALEDAVAEAERQGTLVVAAAGNSIGGLQGTVTAGEYPARYDEVLGVAASDRDDERESWSHHGDWIDVAAPGAIVTTDVDGGYDSAEGTSMSAALVSGQAGLTLSTDGLAGLGSAAHRDHIRDTSEPVTYVDAGRVDTGRAVAAGITDETPGDDATADGTVAGATFVDADLDGRPADDDEGVAAAVVLRDADGERVAATHVDAAAPRYALDVAPGDYTVEVQPEDPDGVEPVTETAANVSLGEADEAVVDFGFATITGAIDGVVTRRDGDGQPAAGLRLALHDEHTGDVRELVTDADGRYAATGLRHGPYRMEIADDGVRAVDGPAELWLHPHESATVDLKVRIDDATDPTTRLAGVNRFATAAEVARDTHPQGADTVLVATGTDYPDALAGGAAAAARDAPLLLVTPDGVPPATADALAALGPRRIVVLGGEAAVSPSVVEELAGGGAEVVRRGAADRFATAAAVSAATFEPGVDAAFVATGADHPDALAGAAVAAATEAPVLLTVGEELPEATADELARLQPRRIVVLGGEQAVPGSIEAQLAGFADETVRHAGPDRFATAAAAARAEIGAARQVVVASGLDFPDALAGGPAAAGSGGALLLVGSDALPPATERAVGSLGATEAVIVGGSSAVSDRVEAALRELLRQ